MPPPPPGADQPEPWLKETRALMAAGKLVEARDRIRGLLEPLPRHPLLNLMLGQCLVRLRDDEAAIAPLEIAMKEDPNAKPFGAVLLGVAQQNLGRSAKALPHLETPSGIEEIESLRLFTLAQVLLDLERYEEALRQLDPQGAAGGPLWARHRALLYSGKPEEAFKLLEGKDPLEAGVLRALQLREAGDFEGARKALDAVPAGDAPSSRLLRARITLGIESGDLAAAAAAAESLAELEDRQARGEGLYFRAFLKLLAGGKDGARAAAWEFLAKTPADFSPLRFERLQMRVLVGELKLEDLVAEAKALPRAYANDLYAFAALSTGDRAWAEQAAAATPARNYPHHLIRRLQAR
jgi:predicted Zn-dependent protease